MNTSAPDIERLRAEHEAWCDREAIPKEARGCAEDMMVMSDRGTGHALSAAQRADLAAFCDRWDAVQAALARECTAAVETARSRFNGGMT